MPRFAANLGWLFTELPFLDRFAAARRAGFGGVEFPSPYEHPATEIAKRLEGEGLTCVLFNLPMGDRAKGDIGYACRPGREAEFRDGVARGLEYAAHLRPTRVNVIAGVAHDGEDRGELESRLVSNLRFAAAEFKSAGVPMVVEPLNTHDNPKYLLPRQEDGARIVRQVGGDFGLQLDLYHVAMMGDDPAATLKAVRPWTRHIQFADVPGRGEPGSGTIDFAPLFELIDAQGYGGWVSAEYRPTRATSETLSWLLRSRDTNAQQTGP